MAVAVVTDVDDVRRPFAAILPTPDVDRGRADERAPLESTRSNCPPGMRHSA